MAILTRHGWRVGPDVRPEDSNYWNPGVRFWLVLAQEAALIGHVAAIGSRRVLLLPELRGPRHANLHDRLARYGIEALTWQ